MQAGGGGKWVPTRFEKYSTTAMAFADDLVLLSDSWDGMQKDIAILEVFCDLTRLKTQGEKCHGFYIKPTKDSYPVNVCPAWTFNGTRLHIIEPGISEKYLGLRVDPRCGVIESRTPRENAGLVTTDC